MSRFLFVFIIVWCLSVSCRVSAIENRVPDVEIIIVSMPLIGDNIGITYEKPVEEVIIRNDLANIRRKTGWDFRDVRISKSELPKIPEEMSNANFLTMGVVDSNAGGFKLSPFIEAFKRYDLIEIIFLVQRPFAFQGIRRYEDKNVRVVLVDATDTTYRYRIKLKNKNFKNLMLPIQERRENLTQKPKPFSWGRIAFIAIFALILIGLAAVLFKQKKNQTSRNFQETE